MIVTLPQVMPQIERVGVIDDDVAQAEFTSLWVEEADLEPHIIRAEDHPFSRPEEILERLRRVGAQGAICDHRLTPHQFSTFSGAELSATLYDARLPNILTTQYVDMDVDVSIRKWRHKIPVLLSRDQTDSETIKHGLLECYAELLGEISSARRAYRTLIRVTDIGTEAGDPVLDVIIPSWNPRHAVRFPLSLVQEDLWDQISVETRLLAWVNVGTDDSRELFFDRFELAPEPNSTNGLA